MVFNKRGRYYAPMMLVVLYTMALYLVVEVTIKRHQTAESEAIRIAMAMEEMKWQSPAWSMMDEIVLLGVSYEECFISPFDELFREISGTYGNDWRLMSAIAYVESRFKPYAKSYSGAIGMMQIMPRTANIYGVPITKLPDPVVNIEVANIHYNHIARMLSMPNDIDPVDRAALVLASYNGGIGRVFDAMRLARAFDEDPHEWSVIRKYLALLRNPNFYSREEVRLGRFGTAYMTIRYVDDVLKQYNTYCEQTASYLEHLLPMGRGVHIR